ncbi:Sortilin-Related Receptor [Manis pentadactyla]|nr:Sortilin-Related Receptor [Manis pentadactyla]
MHFCGIIPSRSNTFGAESRRGKRKGGAEKRGREKREGFQLLVLSKATHLDEVSPANLNQDVSFHLHILSQVKPTCAPLLLGMPYEHAGNFRAGGLSWSICLGLTMGRATEAFGCPLAGKSSTRWVVTSAATVESHPMVATGEDKLGTGNSKQQRSINYQPRAPISAHCVEFEIPGTQEDNVGLGEDSEWYQYGIVNGNSIPDNWKAEGLTSQPALDDNHNDWANAIRSGDTYVAPGVC